MAAKVRLNKAAVDGLLLAAITIILSLLTSVSGSKLISVLIWIVKLVATMWALYYFMKKNTQLNTAQGITTTTKDSFKYGLVVSLFSVILIAVYTFISLQFTDIEAAVEQAEQQMGALASSGAGAEYMGWYLNHIESVSVIVILVMYGIWSIIASGIFAGSTKSPENPFANTDEITLKEGE